MLETDDEGQRRLVRYDNGQEEWVSQEHVFTPPEPPVAFGKEEKAVQVRIGTRGGGGGAAEQMNRANVCLRPNKSRRERSTTAGAERERPKSSLLGMHDIAIRLHFVTNRCRRPFLPPHYHCRSESL